MNQVPPQFGPHRNTAPNPSSILLFALIAILSLDSVAQTTHAANKKRPRKPAASSHPRTATKHTSRTASRATHSASSQRYAAPEISPERGTAAAESVQTTLAETPANPFLYVHNLDPFFRALALQQSASTNPLAQDPLPSTPTVRILQFGDSHTAADYFTGAMREQLQSRFGNGGLGFQFPGHPFAGYHLAGSDRSQTPGWFTQGNHFTDLGSGDLGLGGISISTSRPNESISLSTTCTTLQIQYLRQPEGGHLHFTDNGTFISDIDTSTGDPSAPPGADAAGTTTYTCTPGVHDFQLTTLDHAPVTLLGLVTEQPGITYECLGINGAVAPLILRWNQQLFADYLRQRDPALIVLAYGTNEAAQSAAHNDEYVASFAQILQNLHRIVPQAAILVLGPYDRALKTGRGRRAAWHTYDGTERIIADQKQACRLYHCAFYDAQTRMGGPGAMLRWAAAGYAQPDRTHLTGTGYRALAQALYLDLVDAYKNFQQTEHISAPSNARHIQLPAPTRSKERGTTRG
jgi:lysophospholipase L1-like esterase